MKGPTETINGAVIDAVAAMGDAADARAGGAERTGGAGGAGWLEILDALPAAVYTTDAAGRITYFNPACERLSGRTPRVGIDQWCVTWKLYHLDGRPMSHDECPMAIALREGRAVHGMEALAERPDGTRVRFRPYPMPRIDQAGRVTGGFNVLVDVTQRQQAENVLRSSHETFRQLVENSPFGVYVVDADFRLSMVSAGAQNVFKSVRPLIGRDFAEVLRVVWPEPAASEFIARFRHTLETGETYHSPSTVERRADIGQTEAYDWKIERITTPDGRQGVVCHFYDWTERQKLEEALREHRDRLQELVEERTREILEAQQRVRMSERMASLGTLSAGLGHDMGNLLLPVRVRLETLAQMGLPDDATRELAGIRGSLEYLQRLAGGLRQLAVDPARSPSGEPTELTGWWSEAATVLKNTLPRGAQLEGEMPPEECWVRISRAALTQAVFNLVQNAGDVLRERGTGMVRVAVEAAAGHVELSVSDDGPGMSEETTRRCMEPFYTTKTRGVSTGLGLALVYGLVQEAGGTVELRSEPGRGTTFTLRLARAQSPERVAGVRRLAVVDVKDARWRAIVSAELESLSYELATGAERAADADLIVADRVEAGGLARGQVVLLADANGAPESAIALGERPRIQVLRDTLRAVAVRRGEEAARP